ncbi:hypothetical protein [Streptomyces sp. NPDC001070]|nr:hypothetical protein [Streptomyces sp. PA03-1a]
MDSIILWLLAASGVLSVLLFVVRGLLDQLPDVLIAWRRVKRAIQEDEPERTLPSNSREEPAEREGE